MQIPFGEGAAWVLRLFPDSTGVCDADDLIFGPCTRAFSRFGLGGGQIHPVDMLRRDTSALLVAGLPARQAKTFANVIATFAPIVASMAAGEKAVRRRRIKFH
jgi:hypothetical protein